jgi:hypothetical protein
MKYSLNIFIIIILALTLTNGCSDDPSSIGIGLIPPQDTIKLKKIEIKADSAISIITPISGSLSTLVGKYHDPTTNTSAIAYALMQFKGFTNIPDSAVIDSAYINIKINYKYKETTGKIRFSIHEMNTTWNESNFKWDSLSSSSYNPMASGVFEQTIIDDTVLTLYVDSLVKYWVKNKIDAPNGIILIPDLNASDLIIGTRYSSLSDIRSNLTIVYNDTIKYETRSVKNTYIANGEIPTSSEAVYIQGGVGIRSLIRFDSLSIPKQASITQAVLELTATSNTPFINEYGNDSLIVYLSRKNTPPYDSLILGSICSPIINGSHKIYRADIRSIVQLWNIREPNNGIVVKSYSEYTTFDRFGIYGISTDSSLRPKISITYTILP